LQLPFVATEAVECFAKAVAAKDESAAKACSTKAGFTVGPAEGPAAFFHRLVKTSLQLQVLPDSVRSTDKLAVVEAAVTQGDVTHFPLYFFVEERMGNWRISGVSRSAAYAKKVFAGDAPALLDITQLPQNKEVVGWAEDLIAYFEGEDVPETEVEGVEGLIALWKRTVSRAVPGGTFIKHTLDVPWFDRAAVLFESELPTYKEKRWLVAQKLADGRWEPVWFGHDFEPNCLFLKL
jgi:hypothetical protein